jgi:enoyl-CoA hydratase/carnithine racemase
MSARVDIDVRDHIATLTLTDLEKKNAMTVALGDAVKAAVDAVNADDSVRAVVVTGAGADFSAGGDLAMLQQLRTVPFDIAREHMLAFYARYLSLLELRVPTVAAVRGAAIGAGLCVACACDVVVVASDSKLAFNFVSLGLHPGMGGTALVPHKVGPQRAADLLYTGRRFDGAEAKAIGLAVDAVADADVVATARSFAARVAKNAPGSVRDLVSSFRIDRAVLQAALAREALAQARSYASPELGEGLAAIAEKRPPRFA